MSFKLRENKFINYENQNIIRSGEEKSKLPIKELFEGINILGKVKDETLLKKRIEKLNSKFYEETDIYMANKLNMERSYENLFCLIFKQIGLYTEEIDRLISNVNKKCDADLEVIYKIIIA